MKGIIMNRIRQSSKIISVLLLGALCLLLFTNVSRAITADELQKIENAVPTKATVAPKQPRKLLVFNLCTGYSHTAIAYAAKAFELMGQKTGAFEVTQSNEMSVFKPENLNQFDAILFNSTTNLKFDDPALRESLMEFVKGGKGVIGVHAATDNFYTWPEAAKMMGGLFDGHPWGKDQDEWALKIDDLDHPIVAAFKGQGFRLSDEIYRIKAPYSRDRLRVLVSLDMDDEINLSVKGIKQSDIDIPVSWVQNFGKGRVFYCSLGHNHHVFWNPTVLQHYLDGIQFALGDLSAEATPSLEKVLAQIATYEYGQSRKPLTELGVFIRDISDWPQGLRRLEKSLSQFLESNATLAGKQFICRQLSIVGTEDSVPSLAKMLTDAETSDMARYALERIPGGSVNKALREALPKTTGNVRTGIINSLGVRRDTGSVEIFADYIYAPDKEIASAAVAALGQIADSGAAEALGQAKDRTSGKFRELVLDAYLKCADQLAADGHGTHSRAIYRLLYAADQPTRIRIAALTSIVRVRKHGATGIVVDFIKGDDPAMQTAAIGLVRDVPKTDIIKAAAEELLNLPTTAQVQLLSALGDRGDSIALPAVVNAVKSSDQVVRIAALKALGQVGDDSSVGLLAQTAAKTKGDEQQAARDSLYRLRGPNIDNTIIQSIAKADPKVKVELIRSVDERKNSAGVNALFATAVDSDSKVRVESFKALKAVAESKDLPTLVDLLINTKSTERTEAEKTVAAIARKIEDENRRSQVVLSVLPSVKEITPRSSLLRVLGKIGDQNALDVLRGALKDENAEIQKAAINGLSDWPDAGPMPDLLKVVQTSDNEVHRVLALRGFIHLIGLEGGRPAEKTVELYQQAMDLAPNANEKKLVLSGLSKMRDLAALKKAANYLDDKALQEEAAAAVVKIADSIRKRNPQEAKAILLKVLQVSKNDALREQAQKTINRIK